MSSSISFRREKQRTHAQELVEKLEPAYGWLEGSGVRPQLDRFEKLTDWANIQQWPEGRLFGERGEYRWRYSADQGLHLVLIADDCEFYLDKCETIKPSKKPVKLFLWGEWVDPSADSLAANYPQPVFYASEIPQPQLFYPMPQAETDLAKRVPCLSIRRYHHESLGDFERCLGFSYLDKPQQEQ